MTHKNITVIPVLAAIVLIPQLLFWWLAPDLEARWVVYIAGTVLTAGIPAAFFMTWRKTDIRRTAALLIVSAVLEGAAIALSALLLATDTSVRSSVFAFIIMILADVSILIPMMYSALKTPRQGVRPPAATIEIHETPCVRNRDISGTVEQSRIAGTVQSVPLPRHHQHDRKPLPPRPRNR